MAGNNSCSVVSYLEEVKKLRNQRITTTISLSSKRYPSGQTTCLDQDGFPVCKPFKTLQAVLSWKPGLDRLCVATVPLRERDRVGAAPRTIICHDMMGGYLKDSYVQGHADPQDYYLYHWHYVDSFVYFSHNFVTIPPPTWTNAAHRNGCLSLGTIITEWQDGARLCSQLFESDDLVVKLAQRLVDMAEYYNFDGWLVNIENPIKVSRACTSTQMCVILVCITHASHVYMFLPISSPHIILIYFTVHSRNRWRQSILSCHCCIAGCITRGHRLR